MNASSRQTVDVSSSSSLAEDRGAVDHVGMEQGPGETTTVLAPAQPRYFDILNNKFSERIVLLPLCTPIVRCIKDDEIEEVLQDCPNLKFEFVAEPVRRPGLGDGYVAIRAKDTELYITAPPFGDVARKFYTDFFEDKDSPQHLRELAHPDIVSYIIDFLVRPSIVLHEGPGFGYHSVRAMAGPPGLDQLFRIETRDHRGLPLDLCSYEDERALRTYFGAYLRSGPHPYIISQSPLCEDEERWELLSDDGEDED